jgi:hypothetical protein
MAVRPHLLSVSFSCSFLLLFPVVARTPPGFIHAAVPAFAVPYESPLSSSAYCPSAQFRPLLASQLQKINSVFDTKDEDARVGQAALLFQLASDTSILPQLREQGLPRLVLQNCADTDLRSEVGNFNLASLVAISRDKGALVH